MQRLVLTVARYFDGVKPDAGGSVSAYSVAAVAALDNAAVGDFVYSVITRLCFDYDHIEPSGKSLNGTERRN